jgi:hypothetical protein
MISMSGRRTPSGYKSKSSDVNLSSEIYSEMTSVVSPIAHCSKDLQYNVDVRGRLSTPVQLQCIGVN